MSECDATYAGYDISGALITREIPLGGEVFPVLFLARHRTDVTEKRFNRPKILV